MWAFDAEESDLADTTGGNPFDDGHTQVFQPRLVAERIRVQSGWFTVHKPLESTRQFVALNLNERYQPRLLKIQVPASTFVDMRYALDQCGVNHATLFPDVDHVAQLLQWQYTELEDERSRPELKKRGWRPTSGIVGDIAVRPAARKSRRPTT